MSVQEELAEVFCLPDAPDEMLVSPEGPPSFHVFDTSTGEVHQDCPECLARQFEIDLLKADIDTLRMDKGRLKAELAGQRKIEPMAKDIGEVLTFWREQTASVLFGPARAGRMRAHIDAGGPRANRVRARMKERFTVDRLKFAVVGAMDDAWLMGANDRQTRYDDVQTIFRDAPKVEELERAGWLAARKRQGLGADRLHAGSLERAVQNATLAELNPYPRFDSPGIFDSHCPNGNHRLTIAEEDQGALRFTCERECELLSILDGLSLELGDVGLSQTDEEAQQTAEALQARIDAMKQELEGVA